MTGSKPVVPAFDEQRSWVDEIRAENLARAGRRRHAPVPPELWPTRIGEPVVQRYGLDVWMRAEFGGTTITVHRCGFGADTTHTLTTTDGHTVGDRALGAITAAGPGPRTARASQDDEELGGRMREHLCGLVDTIAAHHLNTARSHQLTGQVRARMSAAALAGIAGLYNRTDTREL